MIEACTLSTPTGPLSVLVNTDGAVVAAGFTEPEQLHARLAPERQQELVLRAELGKTSRLIDDYFNGTLDALDHITVDQPGTALQQEVWAGLRAIPAGETRTYTKLAATTSKPRAIRAAGTACGRNLVAPIVPCHRALRLDGTLGGYYYGLEVKRWLLDHEAGASSGPDPRS